MRNEIGLFGAVLSAGLMLGGNALAQTAGGGQQAPVRAEVVQVAPGQPASAAVVVTEPGIRAVDVAPSDPASNDARRIFIDTGVSDVRVNDLLTQVTMNRSELSPCPSNDYIYERARPKWLYQTGRLMVAMEEGATVRVSFSCIEGLQSINAVQFLSLPGERVAQVMPVRADSLEAFANRQRNVPSLAAPTGTNTAGQSAQQRARGVPLP
ncbi:hypothetical protein RDV64_18615 [Acuticoccus sp. MNP-M23]|uniref:hypothetical protein n=1 Tax=Acuticoccus sp. MNP-M23 TaxID=3072793 RepID=UPI00281521B0|nr:hypothetical protein [Acuticoccus sp. MNP-M23]WMS42061.1 hypothetical protein RDV64_18615 [Acuticoccus sp. MNP-M23]